MTAKYTIEQLRARYEQAAKEGDQEAMQLLAPAIGAQMAADAPRQQRQLEYASKVPENAPRKYTTQQLRDRMAQAKAEGDIEAQHMLQAAIDEQSPQEKPYPTMIGRAYQNAGIGVDTLIGGVGGMFSTPLKNAVANLNEHTHDIQQGWPAWLGRIAGETAVAGPVLGRAATVARALPGVLGRMAPTVVNVGGNAVQGAADSPEDRAGGAALGAAVPSLLRTGAAATGAAARGIVNKSGAAQYLEELGRRANQNVFIPISQGVDRYGGWLSNAVKSAYKGILPYAGAGHQLENQSQDAQDSVRRLIMNDTLRRAGINTHMEGSVQEIAQRAKDLYNREVAQTLGDYRIRLNPLEHRYPEELDKDGNELGFSGQMMNVRARAEEYIRANLQNPPGHLTSGVTDKEIHDVVGLVGKKLGQYEIPGEATEDRKGFKVAPTILGVNLHRAIQQVQDELANGKYYDTPVTPELRNAAVGFMRNLVNEEAQATRNELGQMHYSHRPEAEQVANNLDRYNNLVNQWETQVNPWMQLADKAGDRRGDFDFGALARISPRDSQMQRTAQEAAEVFGSDAARTSSEGRHMLHVMQGTVGAGTGAVLGATGGPLGMAVGAAGLVGAGNTAATRPFQRTLYGDTNWQQNLRQRMADPRSREYLLNLLSGAGTAGIEESHASGQ